MQWSWSGPSGTSWTHKQHCSTVASMESSTPPRASTSVVDQPSGLSEKFTGDLVLYTMIREDVARSSKITGGLPSEARPPLWGWVQGNSFGHNLRVAGGLTGDSPLGS